ncbi:polysaccharide biosynthesis tyrosine autokinase [Microbacterium sp.]|uniref:polysaccharide biosynthesis tyrosine autokinase n=1 Tax=Microbacterium sp. TaxID=51671 RepID=UPI0025D2B35C|nr:polysaccharide biosynthesis tyrosine autokinase [Microbacterium sp.]
MELSDYIRVLRKSWLIIVAAALVGVAAAAAYSLTRTPLYSAESQVFVSTQGGGTIGELQQGSTFTQARVTTYTNLVTTPIVMAPAIEELNLDMTPSELAEQVTASSALNTTIIAIQVTDADPVLAADIANALSRSLTKTVEQIEMPTGSDVSPVRLTSVKDAQTGTAPVSPNVPLNLALGALIGLALGIGISVLREVLDTRVRTQRDIASVTDRPLIGAIPFDPRAKDRALIVHDDPLSPRSEAFRALRTNLQFLDMDGGHSFVITSSLPAEGKSTTALNLSLALADAGKNVALLDTDLRKPKVAEYLGIEGGAGLTDVLIGRAKIEDVMQAWGDSSMYVMPAGRIPPNPSELLGSHQMQILLGDLEKAFDIVICDAPPLLLVTDAAILAKQTSGAIVIVSTGRTTTHQLHGTIEALDTVGARVAGVVMTMTPTKGPDSYGYGYGYGSGYGYGYMQKPDAKRARGRKARRAQHEAATVAARASASMANTRSDALGRTRSTSPEPQHTPTE